MALYDTDSLCTGRSIEQQYSHTESSKCHEDHCGEEKSRLELVSTPGY